jgi:hypothetical protein
MPLILAGLLRLPFGTLSHHMSVLIGLLPRVNVTSFSLTLVVIVIKHAQKCNHVQTQCQSHHYP